MQPMELALFHTLVAGHIVTGSTGALAFWVPILARKGGAEHKRWGRVFTFAMLATGCCAVLMALLTTFDADGDASASRGPLRRPASSAASSAG